MKDILKTIKILIQEEMLRKNEETINMWCVRDKQGGIYRE